MSAPGQSQKAGQGAQQIQVAGDLIMGITEERAHEISRQHAEEIVASHAAEAHATILHRINELDERVIEVLGRANQLDSFADPAFQRSYRKAQEGAAASDRTSDYDMLAALLAQRAAQPKNRLATAGIERALEIMDRVDDDALRAVTVMNAVMTLSPNSGLIGHGLDVLDDLFSPLLDGPLPAGSDWIDHLDTLTVVRMDLISGVNPFDTYFSNRFPGYVTEGLPTTDVPVDMDGNLSTFPWAAFVSDHEYKSGYSRISTSNVTTLRHVLTESGMGADVVEAIIEQSKTTFAFETIAPDLVPAFMADARKRPTLGLIANWWDALPYGLQITGVGRTLAIANAYRLDAAGNYPRA